MVLDNGIKQQMTIGEWVNQLKLPADAITGQSETKYLGKLFINQFLIE